jgi:5-methylthioribose kinase
MTGQPTEVPTALLSAESVGAYVVGRGLFGPDEPLEVRVLGGGVSNVVLSVRGGGRRVVVKQALPRLRVADDWPAKRERALTEAGALRLAARIAPGSAPAVLDADPDLCALAIEEAPDGWVDWKQRLLAADADPAIARRLGERLGAWHSATFGDAGVARDFDDLEAFDQLRVDPYYRTVARRLPPLAAAVEAYVRQMEATHVCLVHGDYSPKNVLVGDGLWVVDFEVAHCGDPAFDLAFMLNHLLLKRLHVPGAAAALEDCAVAFLDAYSAAVPAGLEPEPGYVLGHVGCLMVARVDGKSPAEYLLPDERARARTAGTELLLRPPNGLAGAFDVMSRASA